MLTALPDLVLEAVRTSVEVVRTIVHRKRILHPVKCKLSESDSVCISAGNLSCARSVTEIACGIRISQDDVSEDTISVRHDSSNDACTDV